MKIKLFGQLAEIAGTNMAQVHGVGDSEQLLEAVFIKYPLLKGQPFSLSVDRKVVRELSSIHPGSELALLPPFAGG